MATPALRHFRGSVVTCGGSRLRGSTDTFAAPAPEADVLRVSLAMLADKDSGRVAGNWRASLANSVA
jgi:hypothetical protein